MANVYYMQASFHNIVSPLGMVASGHVGAAVQNLHSLELPYHEDQVDWRWDLVDSDEPLIQDGHFVVPQGPGLGVTFNEEAARSHIKPGYTYFD